MIDIKSELLQANHNLILKDNKPDRRLFELWNWTENRLADIENFNLRSILINTFRRRKIDIPD